MKPEPTRAQQRVLKKSLALPEVGRLLIFPLNSRLEVIPQKSLESKADQLTKSGESPSRSSH